MGHFSHGKWFCSPACAEKDPEVKKIKEMLENKDKVVDELDDEELDGVTGEVDL